MAKKSHKNIKILGELGEVYKNGRSKMQSYRMYCVICDEKCTRVAGKEADCIDLDFVKRHDTCK